MIYCKKRLCNRGLTNKPPHKGENIYDEPFGVVYINPAHGLNTGEARAATTTSFDNQEHQNIPYSSYPQTSAIITTAADNIKDNTQVVIYNVISTNGSTSSPHVTRNADKSCDTAQYAPITLPPCDELNYNAVKHCTTKVSRSSRIASSVNTATEGQYGPIIQLPSDEYPTANKCLTTKVSPSSQGVDTEHS